VSVKSFYDVVLCNEDKTDFKKPMRIKLLCKKPIGNFDVTYSLFSIYMTVADKSLCLCLEKLQLIAANIVNYLLETNRVLGSS
jgi:hypothetical protein